MRSNTVLVLLVVVFITALSNGFELLFRLAYLLAAVLVAGYAWARINLRQVTTVRQGGTDRRQVGQILEERFRVENTGKLPKLWVEVHDHSNLPHHYVSRAVNLPANTFRTWRVRTVCRQRGRFRLGPLTLISGDPFGLFRLERRISETSSLLVYPTTVDLPAFALSEAELPGEGRLRRRTHYVTPNAAGVRDYVFGDSYNRIHWPTTAHTGHLMVKEFELDPAADIWLVLDMHQEVQAGQDEESTEEYGIIIAASLAKRYVQEGRPVGLIAVGHEREFLPAERGGAQFSRILESLALIRADGRAPLAEVLIAEGRRFSRHSALIIITPSTDERWVTSLQQVIQRGARPVTIVLEPTTFGGKNGSAVLIGVLAASNIPCYLVKQGEPLAKSLASVPPGLPPSAVVAGSTYARSTPQG